MIRSARLFFVLFVFLLPAGCVGLDPGPARVTVLLPTNISRATQADRMPAQVVVAYPAADGATGTDRIMALVNGYELRALDSAKWVNPVPVIVQRQFVDALEASRRFTSVNWDADDVNDQYRLATDIRRFFLRYDTPGGPPAADISMVFSLIRTDTGTILARRYVRVEKASQGNSLDAFVAAFSLAMDDTLEQTVQWVVETLEKER